MSRPTIARITDCVVSSSIGFVRTWRPSRITVTRWQIAKISSSRCETKSTALPRARSVSTMPNSRSTSVRRQRRGRLVHHDHARVRRQRLRDLDELLVGDREPAREPVGVEPDAELLEHRGRLAAHPPAVDAAEPLERLHADEDVLGDGQVGEERRLLEDDRDPGRLRLLGVVEDRLLAVEQQPAGVGPVDAGEDLDERRLAGAVLADEAVHLTGEELDVAVLERVNGAEALLGVFEREDWAGRAVSSRSSASRWGRRAERGAPIVLS